MQEARKRIPLQEVRWPEQFCPQNDVSVWLELCGREGVQNEPGMAVVAPSVSSFCILVMMQGDREMRSPSRACDFQHSLNDQPTLLLVITPDNDIRAELVLVGGHSERFFFQDGMSFFRSPALVPVK